MCGRAIQAQSTGRPYFLQMRRSSRTPWSSIGFAHRVFSGLAPASQFGTSFMISASLALTFSIRYAVLWSDHAANVAGRRNDQRRRAEACRLLLECCIQQRATGSERVQEGGLGRGLGAGSSPDVVLRRQEGHRRQADILLLTPPLPAAARRTAQGVSTDPQHSARAVELCTVVSGWP